MHELRRIDALIAEQIMGWENIRSIPYEISGGELMGNSPDSTGLLVVPWYSLEIVSAWKVWEHLYTSREYCCMDIKHPYAEGWEVVLIRTYEEHEKSRPMVSNIETAPLAICLAVLKAKGIIP